MIIILHTLNVTDHKIFLYATCLAYKMLGCGYIYQLCGSCMTMRLSKPIFKVSVDEKLNDNKNEYWLLKTRTFVPVYDSKYDKC